MYKELGSFLRNIAFQKSIWKDGELWTAVVVGIGSGCWFFKVPAVIDKIRGHFDDLLQVTSIVFGFVLTSLFFHIEAAGSWKSEEKIRSVTGKLIGWHVWTIICMLFQLAFILVLWAVEADLNFPRKIRASLYGFLSFNIVYCGCQILNHSLLVWWTFTKREELERSKPNSEKS